MANPFKCRECGAVGPPVQVSGPVEGRKWEYHTVWVDSDGDFNHEYDDYADDESYITGYDRFICCECNASATTIERLLVVVGAPCYPGTDREITVGDRVQVNGYDIDGQPWVGVARVDSLDDDDDDEYQVFVKFEEGGTAVWFKPESVTLLPAAEQGSDTEEVVEAELPAALRELLARSRGQS